jgi:hypothetical protein
VAGGSARAVGGLPLRSHRALAAILGAIDEDRLDADGARGPVQVPVAREAWRAILQREEQVEDVMAADAVDIRGSSLFGVGTLTGARWPGSERLPLDRALSPLAAKRSTHSPTLVVPHASTRWPTGAERSRGGYCAHHGQEPPRRATRAERPPACRSLAPQSGARLRSRHTVRDVG